MTAIDFSSFVDQLATASGDTILPFFRTALAVENKKVGGFDPVTAADRAAEQTMRAVIRRHFPDHGILGEEYGVAHQDGHGFSTAVTWSLVISLGLWRVVFGQLCARATSGQMVLLSAKPLMCPDVSYLFKNESLCF